MSPTGTLSTFGDAHFSGSSGEQHPSPPVIGLFTTGDGHGYTLVNTGGTPTAFPR